jgi:hypothetical protein
MRHKLIASSFKLSWIQREILRDLLTLYMEVESSGDAKAKHFLELEGVRLKDLQAGFPKSSANRTALTRALARLEEFGLVLRTNVTSGVPFGPAKGYVRTRVEQPHARTDHVKLTGAGRVAARQVVVLPLTPDEKECG